MQHSLLSQEDAAGSHLSARVIRGSTGDQLFPLHDHFWLMAVQKGFILYGNTPENCPELERLLCGDKSHFQSDGSYQRSE